MFRYFLLLLFCIRSSVCYVVCVVLFIVVVVSCFCASVCYLVVVAVVVAVVVVGFLGVRKPSLWEVSGSPETPFF